MLRRRILASAMASVMALGSVAIVASAEETAVKPVKTKADLEALVGANGTYGDAYRSNDIYNYGTRFSEKMVEVLEFADNVLDSSESTVDDYTAAYDMVEAVAATATLYTAQQLTELLSACKSAYESNNILNEEIGDEIYDPDKYSKLVDAYEEAESVLNSSDSRIITDAYIDLKDAKDNLAELAKVTKTEFTAAIKAMEQALNKEKAYDQWRRGSFSWGTYYNGAVWFYFDKWFDGAIKGKKTTISYGELFDQMNNFTPFIYDKYKQFVEVKTAAKTTMPNIVAAFETARIVTEAINSWTADDTNRATKASVTKILDQYHGQLAFDYASDEVIELFDAIKNSVNGVKLEVNDGRDATKFVTTTPGEYAQTTGFFENGFIVSRGKNGKLLEASFTITADEDFYIVVDENGYVKYHDVDVTLEDGTVVTKSVPWISKTTVKDEKIKKVSKKTKVDITKFVPIQLTAKLLATDKHLDNYVVDADNEVYGGPDLWKWWAEANAFFTYDGDPKSEKGEDNFVSLGQVMPIVYKYLDEEYKNGDTSIMELDTIGQIAEDTIKGSAAEWTIVYRALKYVLEDQYNGSNCMHTRKDVADLIEATYDLEAKTSKAAIFADALNELVKVARANARDWMKEANANRKYKDNVSAPLDLYADDVYHMLWDAYDKLLKQYNAFALSYGDAYELISEAESMIDEGEIEETAELRAAITELSYRLAVVKEPVHVVEGDLDDAPYTDDRQLLEYNRIFTHKYSDGCNGAGCDTHVFDITVNGNAVKVKHSSDHIALTKAYYALKTALEAKPVELKGDYDGNGKVDALDAAAILKDIANAAELKAIGDYDANGVVNALDAAAILKAVADGVL